MTIQRRPGPVYIAEPLLSVGVGGSASLEALVINTAAAGDNFTLSVVGLEALNPAWLHFEPATLALGAGQFKTTRLVLSIPAGQCSAAGAYPVAVRATGQTGGLLGEANAVVQISANPPTLRDVLPANGSRVGSTQALFSWRSNTPGTSTLYVRPQGGSNFTSYALAANAQDPTLYTVSVSLAQGAYEWYGTTVNSCGTTSTGSASAPNTFNVTPSVSFVDRAYTFTIRDDYDVTTDVNGNPLAVRLRNDDAVAHTVKVSVNSPYADLIVGFIGSGSLNQASTLQPSEIRTLTLHAFTQDIQQTSYAVTFSLLTDNATDSVPLTLTIQQPQPNIVFQTLSVDPNTRITMARLTNSGANVTDLDFDVIQNASGIPANVTVLPDLHHVYLPAGQSIDFQIIPLDLAGQTGYTPLPNSTRLVSSAANPTGSSTLNTAQQTLPGPFDGKVCAGKDWCYLIPAVCDNHCGTGLLPFSFNVTQPVTNTVSSSAWYCTNKPNIDVAMRPSISTRPTPAS